jgi:hypothetical protein
MEGNDTVKKRKPAKKTPPKDIRLNLSGVKFEDALRVLLRTPVPTAIQKPKK